MITLELALCSIRDGQWFGFSDPENKTYENIVLLDTPEGRSFVEEHGALPSEQDLQVIIDDLTSAETRETAKHQRATAVAAITVTTTAGNTFDGDEDSQNRMTRAILGMNDVETIVWTLANNSTLAVNKAELAEALRLAGQAQAALWVI